MLHRRLKDQSRSGVRADRTRIRPRLELLEDRTAPATFVVNSLADGAPAADGQLTLREAVTAANTNAASGDAGPGDAGSLDTIVFASSIAGGTINLNTAVASPLAAAGMNDTGLVLNGDGGALTIIGPNGVKSGMTISRATGAPSFRIFAVAGASPVTLSNLTITNGNATIANAAAVTAAVGGGLANAGITNLNNVLITGNVAQDDAGGVANTGTLMVTNSRLENNSAGDDGGGIYARGGATTMVQASMIIGNLAGTAPPKSPTELRTGGGICVASGAGGVFSLTNSTVSGNFTPDTGGGVQSETPTTTIRGSTISENTASSGGGFASLSGVPVNIVNSTIANNLATGANSGLPIGTTLGVGGGVFYTDTSTSSPTMNIVNTTIVRNSSINAGGGIRQEGSTTINFNNSINSLNLASPPSPAPAPDRSTIGGGTFNSNSSLEGMNPRLGPLQDNGGPTFTIAPLPALPGTPSLVIDQGSNAQAVDPSMGGVTLTTDQRGTGFPRILDGDGNGSTIVDRGAVEFFIATTTTMLAVTQNGNPVTTTATSSPVTLQATVTSGTTGVMPTGTVNFFDDPDGQTGPNAPIQVNNTPIAVTGSGMATLPNVALGNGPHNLYAVYTPDSRAFNGSASQTQTVTANIIDTVGTVVPASAMGGPVFSLLAVNANRPNGADFSYSFGFAGSLPVFGNFNGSADGLGGPGIAVPMGGTLMWTLADENPPVLPNLPSFSFGTPGQIPVAGDWNGNGTDGIGVYDPVSGFWQLRNQPNGGPADFTFQFGGMGFLPVVGNWDGSADGTQEVGVYQQATGMWFLAANTPTTGFPTLGSMFSFGGTPGAIPVAGDWNGSGTDGIGIFGQLQAGSPFSQFLLRNQPNAGPADVNSGNLIFAGLPGYMVVSGNYGPAPNSINELTIPMPLQSATGEGAGAAALPQAQLNTIVDAALGRLADAGVDAGIINALAQAEYVVGDLPAGYLGSAEVASNRVVIDADAAGNGWFVDPTPGEDSEFDAGSPAGMDLLTTVLHEMGHLTGRLDNDGTELMDGFLSEGVRRVEDLDAVFSNGL